MADAAAPPPKVVKRVELLLANRKAVYFMLLGMMQDGHLPNGSFSIVALKFSVHSKTISRLWHLLRAKVDTHLITQNNQPPTVDANGNNKTINLLPDALFATKKSSCGRKRKWDRDQVKAQVRAIPKKKRKTWRAMAARTNIPMTTLHRMYKGDKIFKRHTSALKPTLTPSNELSRFLYALDQVDTSTINLRSGPKFKDMMDRVHIDEKWFFLCNEGERYILVSDEEAPKRFVKHKSHVTKVMFLVAQARPRYVNNTY